MKGILIRWLVSAIALYFTALLAQVLGLAIRVESAAGALLAVLALAIVNALIRPLVLLMTLPLNCLTLGLFTFLVNALMFWLVGVVRIPGFQVDGFLAAIFGSVVMGVIAGLANQIIAPKEK